MDIRKVQDADLENKKILLRVDFNVAVENGKVMESFKIEAAKETIDYILKKGGKVSLISHLGRPDGKVNPQFSFAPIVESIGDILGVKIRFVSDCVGEEVRKDLEKFNAEEILLLENSRFYPGEEANDPEFSKLIAENFDIFINDAFSVCHRDQSSVTGVAKILPSYAGLRLQKEIENLDKVKLNPEAPAVAIIGGAKIETKLPLIKELEEFYNNILVGGMIANEAIDQNLKFSGKVLLPEDLAIDRLDIGPKTIERFGKIISTAKTIVWNGPMGKFEEKPYDAGTREVLRAVIKSGAYVLMGGGESVQILEQSDAMEKISFVSTGGGAMLEYLSGNQMPGIKVLKIKS